MLIDGWVSWYRLGIEGVIKFKKDFTFDEDNYSLTLPLMSKITAAAEKRERREKRGNREERNEGGEVTVNVFDKVRVGIEVQKDKNTLRGKVVMRLVEPNVCV